MTKLSEQMRIYSHDKATQSEKEQIKKMYGENYYGLNYDDILPVVGMKIKAAGMTVIITGVEWKESHNVIMVDTDKGRQGWPSVLKMIAAGQATIIE